MNTKQVIGICSWFLFFEIVIKHITIVCAQEDKMDFDMDDLIDKKTKKLKPVKEVIDDSLMSRDFPRIIDCGPDEAQNWYEPDPEDCSCYFVCTGRFYVHRQCSSGLIFDTKTHECNWPDVVDCGERPAPWTIPEYVGPHYNPHQYNIYMNSNKKIQRKHNQDDSDRSHWLLEDDTGKDVEYEYFM